MTDVFARFTDEDVRDLMAEYPLAWILSENGGAEQAVQLPLLAEWSDAGTLKSLLGHIPRRHPLVPALEADRRALVLFQGPQGYISPRQAGVEDWAPTWNFARLRIEVELDFLPGETDMALTTLVHAMESARPDPWDISVLGDRYEGMAQQVVAFRARATHVGGRFKLGQDELPDVREAIVRSLGDSSLARWMRRFDKQGMSS